MTDYINAKEVAALLGVCWKTVYLWNARHEGFPKRFKEPGRRGWRRSEIEEYKKDMEA
jgi:predicted DNA-binding transcriptional regulator AlpA